TRRTGGAIELNGVATPPPVVGILLCHGLFGCSVNVLSRRFLVQLLCSRPGSWCLCCCGVRRSFLGLHDWSLDCKLWDGVVLFNHSEGPFYFLAIVVWTVAS
ncbi:hypothetical protein A2U01_0009466, partial [Trifolium medium]|nr:hypothetical protein [Trifolium medium]